MSAKHSPVNSEKYAALLSVWYRNLKTDFRVSQKIIFFYICDSTFSRHKLLPASFQMECTELQSDIQIRENFDGVSSLDFYRSCLPRDKYPLLHNHALPVSSLFGSTDICEQLFSRMKHIKSKIRTKISDELLENSLRIATASIKPDIDAPVSQLQGQTSH